jgi:hypothetical protein
MGRHAKHHPSAGEFIDANRWRVKPSDAAQRLAERDARLAADTRNDCQKILGDPPPSRSALMQVRTSAPKSIRGAGGVRVDLWRPPRK